MSQFLVQGGYKLKGVVRPSGSKNAVLPILAATILCKNDCIIKNVPDIADVHTMLKVLDFLGAKSKFENGEILINTEMLKNKHISADYVCKMRASILLIGPLLARFGEVNIAFPGGCVLGKRSIDAHIEALKQLGAEVHITDENIKIKLKKPKDAVIIMPEMSVTATENMIMASVLSSGKIAIHLAACEPHVVDLCKFLVNSGAQISGIATNKLIIEGVDHLVGNEYKVRSDYLEIGTFALAAVLTNGEITITDLPNEDLDLFLYTLWKSGGNFEIDKNILKIYPSKELKAVDVLHTAVHPGFPTDLQAPFGVLLTQCKGETMIFETLFEGRLNYLTQLEEMGANIQILNPHQAKIIGPTKLKGMPIISNDIRAGAAMVLASLIAEGETLISNINYIDRGYERLDEKLRLIGANIQRI